MCRRTRLNWSMIFAKQAAYNHPVICKWIANQGRAVSREVALGNLLSSWNTPILWQLFAATSFFRPAVIYNSSGEGNLIDRQGIFICPRLLPAATSKRGWFRWTPESENLKRERFRRTKNSRWILYALGNRSSRAQRTTNNIWKLFLEKDIAAGLLLTLKLLWGWRGGPVERRSRETLNKSYFFLQRKFSWTLSTFLCTRPTLMYRIINKNLSEFLMREKHSLFKVLRLPSSTNSIFRSYRVNREQGRVFREGNDGNVVWTGLASVFQNCLVPSFGTLLKKFARYRCGINQFDEVIAASRDFLDTQRSQYSRENVTAIMRFDSLISGRTAE